MKIVGDIVEILRAGGVGVLPTDTIYGLVGSALKPKTVERIYRLRKRNRKKPMIILIGSMRDLSRFGVRPDRKTMRFLRAIWLRQKQHTNILENVGMLFCDGKYSRVCSPKLKRRRESENSAKLENSAKQGLGRQARPVSVILSLNPKRYTLNAKFKYLHRGTKSLAFRLPRPYWLRKLVASIGPLVAPSANSEGKPPARTIREAERYFKDRVNFYVNGGMLRGQPSRLIQVVGGKLKTLRK